MLKKKLLGSAVGLCLLSSCALADENSGFYLGLEGGYIHSAYKQVLTDIVTGVSLTSPTESLNGFNLGAKLGYRFTENHRMYFNIGSDMGLSIPDDGGDVDISTMRYILGYDFTPSITDSFRGVLGLYAGYTTLKTKFNFLGATENINYGGVVGGVKVGAMYEINANNELELGLKYEGMNLENTTELALKSEPKPTNLHLYVGYAYRF